MKYSPLLEALIEAFRCLPGVGPKSAQRMAFHLLERGREKGMHLADSLSEAIEKIQHCEQCRNFSEAPLCGICASTKREHQVICVVETPADVVAIEQAHSFRGRYFVLMGHLSPIDGIGPEDIGLPLLQAQCKQHNISEMILATNTTVEGETTAHYIAEMAKQLNIQTSRLAHGIPLGGELIYSDPNTLAHAFERRVPT